VDAVLKYGYNSKIMFSSVRHAEHVRNAINIGVHTITVPLKVLKGLTENNFTTVGTDQFLQDTRLMTMRVRDAASKVNPVVPATAMLKDALVKMTEYGFGAVTITNSDGSVRGVFTDGDIRRLLQTEGEHILDKKMDAMIYKTPISIEGSALLNDAHNLFKKTNVDTILITEDGRPVGMLDIQDLEA
jgi:signal-transduction protein with cAMP-binding, CBS, and nucleotidyltransferase domain